MTIIITVLIRPTRPPDHHHHCAPQAHQTATLLTVLEPTEVEFSLFQEGQRNSEKAARCQLDLCVVIFRTSSCGAPQIGKLVQHSKRQVGALN